MTMTYTFSIGPTGYDSFDNVDSYVPWIEDALAEHGREFDAIHASPPCQGYSIMHNLPWLRGRDYPLLILPTIEMLEALGKPYVVENVMGARHGSKTLQKRGLESHGLKAGWLCGTMFGLPFYRHRLFATNWFWLAPGHPKHIQRIRAGRELKDRASVETATKAAPATGGDPATGGFGSWTASNHSPRPAMRRAKVSPAP